MNKKQLYEAAKAAHEAAVKGKKSQKTVDELKVAMDAAEKAWKDEEAKAGEDVTPEQFRQMLTDATGQAVKAALDGQEKAKLEAEEKAKADAAEADKLTVTKARDMVSASVKEAVEAAVKALPRPSKMVFGDGDEGRIEVPWSWTKGNLPLHGRQLFNIIATAVNDQRRAQPDRHIKLMAVTPEEIKAGESKGAQMMARYKSKLSGSTEEAMKAHKALTSTGSGAGDELVPTDLASALQMRFFLETPLGALFQSREIDMPTNPFELPLITSFPKMFYESVESTATTESSPGTARITLTAKKFIGESRLSYEVDEDAVIAVLPMVESQLSKSAANHYEDTLINGDTAGTQDVRDVISDAVIASVANHHYRAFDGFRKMALAQAATRFDATGVDKASLTAGRKALGKYGVPARDCVWIFGPKGFNDLMAIAEVATIEKYGPRATIVVGEISSYQGIPVQVSSYCREDLNASGVHDNVTETNGSFLCVNVPHFVTGSKRDFLVETDRNISTQQLQVVASFRRAFTPSEALSATITAASIGYIYVA